MIPRNPLLRIALIAALVFSTSAAVAGHPMFRQAVGRIVAVDPAAQRFTFQRTDNGKLLVLTWNRRTKFYHGAATGTANMLGRGQSARVSYRLPLFGPDYAGRVVVTGPASQSGKTPAIHRPSLHKLTKPF